MALDASRWGTAIHNAVQNLTIPQNRVMTSEELEAFWQAVAGEHKTEINDNAEVSTSVAVTSVSGVTPGGGVSGPGSGSGSGTVA